MTERATAKGCLIFLAGLLALPIALYFGMRWDDTRGRLPPQVEYSYVVTSSMKLLGPLEGCSYAVYRLTPETLAKLSKGGLGFLSGTRPSQSAETNAYGEWKETPALEPDSVLKYAEGAPWKALYGRDGCGDQKAGRAFPTMTSLIEQGNFYALTSNEEGIVVISPRRGLAVFMYYG